MCADKNLTKILGQILGNPGITSDLDGLIPDPIPDKNSLKLFGNLYIFRVRCSQVVNNEQDEYDRSVENSSWFYT